MRISKSAGGRGQLFPPFFLHNGGLDRPPNECAATSLTGDFVNFGDECVVHLYVHSHVSTIAH
jgi:hypothetical protein